jgi:hypothetical protein
MAAWKSNDLRSVLHDARNFLKSGEQLKSPTNESVCFSKISFNVVNRCFHVQTLDLGFLSVFD